jgi:hypothetical protein
MVWRRNAACDDRHGHHNDDAIDNDDYGAACNDGTVNNDNHYNNAIDNHDGTACNNRAVGDNDNTAVNGNGHRYLWHDQPVRLAISARAHARCHQG